MHRLFAAIAVPDEIAERLLPLRTNIPGAHWRRRDHFHITLQFYGSVQLEIAEEVAAALEQVQAPVLNLRLDGVGWFGRKEPRALYARIGDNADLTTLARECRKIARQFGVKIDSNPFKPHVTLAYCKDISLEAVHEWSETFQMLRSQPFQVDQFHLFESFTGSGRQSRYQAQADYRMDAQ